MEYIQETFSNILDVKFSDDSPEECGVNDPKKYDGLGVNFQAHLRLEAGTHVTDETKGLSVMRREYNFKRCIRTRIASSCSCDCGPQKSS
jgi:hypothetical protein